MRGGLEARDISVYVAGRSLLDGVSLEVVPGRLTVLVGPNGAGKSTLLKVLAGDITPTRGSVSLNGRPLDRIPAEECARIRAVLPQSTELAFALRAWELVELGRHPHRRTSTPGEDHTAIRAALRATDSMAFSVRDCSTLSGGERQRVHFARVLAQMDSPTPDLAARYLLLDEPTANLDLFHQSAILELARAVAEAGLGVLVVLHDLNLAAIYADTLAVLGGGRIDCIDSPQNVLTVERIQRVWRVPCDVDISAGGAVRVNVRRVS